MGRGQWSFFRWGVLTGALGITLAVSLPASEAAATESAATVVELFTSQGCSSCPPANANLATIAGRPGVLALSFGVTYWDKLGWPDTFGSPDYTKRQWDYARALGHDQVWTPQIVVNGRTDVVGSQLSEIDDAIGKSIAVSAGPAITLTDDHVSIAAGPASAQSDDVWLVRYDPRIVDVPVRAGENVGKTLPHRNVVHEFKRLGVWSGQAVDFPLPPVTDAHYLTAILVQGGASGPILTAVHSS